AGVAGDEYLVAPDDGAGASRPRKVELPDEVVLVAPLGRQVLLRADAGAAGAAEVRPVGGAGRPGEDGDAKGGSRQCFRIHGSSPDGEAGGPLFHEPRGIALPGVAPVCLPRSSTSCPLTITYSTPSLYWNGFSYVALSVTRSGSKSVMSA